MKAKRHGRDSSPTKSTKAQRGTADAMSDLTELLAPALRSEIPAATLVSAMRERILTRAAPAATKSFKTPGADSTVMPGFVVSRAGSGQAHEIFPGVHARLLVSDGHSETILLDCRAGAKVLPHYHAGEEELFVISGELRFADGTALCAGDFMFGRAGSSHVIAEALEPTLVLVRTSQPLHRYRVLAP